MSEHYTRNTVSAEAWCAKCQKRTQHRVDDRRIGPCLDCLGRLQARHDSQQQKKFCACGRLAVALCDGELDGAFCNKPVCEVHQKQYGSRRYCAECDARRAAQLQGNQGSLIFDAT